ncbi:nucleoside deaminase [Leptolyngbya sp. PCC 6406]|uniref:nucleoside deaminase n=1 Tax=Leptolyngbya sp. PCC 6406 TaxID=1173264 RepID=UPI0002ACC96C|nr:nucleoside deaminase [Leptolyngbya sp. PCC 6406]
MDNDSEQLMQVAIDLSFEAMRSQRGGPYGAIVVRDGEIIGRGMNEVTSRHDPTAHAEMTAIRQACAHLQSWHLEGCELYTSCEPCPMCMAATYWARIDRVYYGNSKEVAARYGFNSQIFYDELALPLSQRQITMIPYMETEAEAAFEEWDAKADKADY